MIFLRFLNEFTISLEKLENTNSDLQRGPWNFHKTPWKPKTNRAGVPGRSWGQRRRRRPVSRRGGGSLAAGMAPRGESSPSSTCGWVLWSTGVAGAGSAAAHRERRRRLQRAAALRCGREGEDRLGRCTGPRVSCSGG